MPSVAWIWPADIFCLASVVGYFFFLMNPEVPHKIASFCILFKN